MCATRCRQRATDCCLLYQGQLQRCAGRPSGAHLRPLDLTRVVGTRGRAVEAHSAQHLLRRPRRARPPLRICLRSGGFHTPFETRSVARSVRCGQLALEQGRELTPSNARTPRNRGKLSLRPRRNALTLRGQKYYPLQQQRATVGHGMMQQTLPGRFDFSQELTQ